MSAPWMRIETWIIRHKSVLFDLFVVASTTGQSIIVDDAETRAKRFGSLDDAVRFIRRHDLADRFEIVPLRQAR